MSLTGSNPHDATNTNEDVSRIAVCKVQYSFFVSASLLNQWGITWFFIPIEHWLARPGQAAAFNTISPIVLLGALVSSALLNLATLVSMGREEEGSGTVRVVKLRVKSGNLTVLGLGLLLTGILLGYAFVENFGARVRL